MIKIKTKTRTAQPLLSTLYFRASDFIRSTGSRNLWLVFGLLLLGMTITVLASLYLKSEVERAAEREFDFISSEIQLNIADRLAASAQVLYSGAALFDSSETVTREEWRIFIEQIRIEEQLPGTQGVGFAMLIPPDQLEQHIQQIRDEGFPEYTVRPEGDREAYSSIIYLEPFSGRNLRAFGYDMFSEPVRRAAMEQARDENIAVLSGKVVLVQETNEDVQAGTLMYVPVYRKGMSIETVEQRRAAIIGWVYSPYRITDLMRGTLRNWEAEQGNQHIHLQVYDGDVISSDTLLFDSLSEADKTLAASTSEFSKLTPVNFKGHHWTLRFSLTGGLSALADYDSFWFVLSGGISFTIFLVGLALSLLRTQVNAQRIAEELTIYLKESEEKYSIVFNNEVYAICIFDLETLELLEVNNTYERVYGYSRDELLSGMTIHNITAEHQASDAATVKATREGTTFIPLRYHRKKDGTVFPVEIVGGPYVWRGRKVMFALAHDITKREKMVDAIRTSEQKYRLLFETLNEGIALNEIVYDENAEMIDYRILEVNEAFYSTADYIDPVVGSLATNLYGMTLEIIQSFWREHKDRKTIQLTEFSSPLNGRHFIISTSPFIDGRFVTSFFDITERKQMEIDLQAQRDYATQIVNVMGQGLTVTDADGRFEFANPAYARLFGYTAEDLIGKRPSDITIPDDHVILAEQRRLRQNGQSSTYESRLIRADGSIAHVLITAVPRSLNLDGKFYGAIAVITDLTDQKLIENKLRASEEKYRTVANFTHDWEAWRGSDGTYLYTSPSCERITGHTMAEFLANPDLILEIAHSDDQPILSEHLRAASQEVKDKDLEIDFRIITPGGETRWIAHSCTSVYSEDGQWIGRRESNRDITDRRKSEEEIRLLNTELGKLASMDGLTAINNHRTLLKLAEREFNVAMRYKYPLSMLFFDIDHFKQVNDTFGHVIGDEAIKLTIQTVCTKLRSADLIGRYGGDEFVILLPRTSAQDALPLAERIHASIADMRLDTDIGVLTLTISIGIAQSIHDALEPDTVESLLLRADQALYAAKQGGRNRTVIFDEKSP